MNKRETEALIRHHTYIERFGSGLANRTLELFDNEQLKALATSSKAVFRNKLVAILNKDKTAAKKMLNKELRQMALAEVSFVRQLSLDAKDLKYTAKQLDEVIQRALSKPLVDTNIEIQSLYDSAFNKKEEITKALDSMVANGIKTSAVAATEFGFMLTQFANNMKVANTTMSFAVSNEIREDAYSKSNVVERIVMSAVLDGRTSKFCMGIDGTIYIKGEGPRSPFHPRCRTIGIPILDGETDEEVKDILSFRSSIGAGKNYEKGDDKGLRAHKRQLEKGKIKTKDNTTSNKSSSSYGNFLSSQINTKQGRQFIEDRLGVRKGRHFMELVKRGATPDMALKKALVTEAKDLDITGLKKRIKRNKPKKGGGGSSTPKTVKTPKTAIQKPKNPILNSVANKYFEATPEKYQYNHIKKLLQKDDGFEVFIESSGETAYYSPTTKVINMKTIPNKEKVREQITFNHEFGHRSDEVLFKHKEAFGGKADFDGINYPRDTITSTKDWFKATLTDSDNMREMGRKEYYLLRKDDKPYRSSRMEKIIDDVDIGLKEGTKEERMKQLISLSEKNLKGYRKGLFNILEEKRINLMNSPISPTDKETFIDSIFNGFEMLLRSQATNTNSTIIETFFDKISYLPEPDNGSARMLKFADAIGSTTRNYFGYGHRASYYEAPWGKSNRSSEAFAQLFALYKDPDLKKAFDTFIPEQVKLFKKLFKLEGIEL